MWEYLFVSAILLSLLMCAYPGAVNTEAFRRGVSGGTGRALWTELGSSIGDMVWAALAMIGLALLLADGTTRILLGIGGGALLLYLAFQAIKDARKGIVIEGEAKGNRNDFMTGALISLGNPFQIAFWVGIGGSAIATIVTNPTSMDYAIFFIGYFVGSIGWAFGYAGLIGHGRRYITPRLFKVINVLCALVMIYFALTMLWSIFAT
jgi:chemosensory pili system protein ChpE